MAQVPSNLNLGTGSDPYDKVIVHPVVVFNILDHWIRRPDTKQRVIGTLLGSITEDGNVEIRNCYPVPHTEAEQIAVNLEYHRNMLQLHARVAPEDVVVGWYATGNEVKMSSGLIHNFYQREMNQNAPVHLLLDTDLSKGKIEVTTFHGFQINFGEKGALQQYFLPLPNEYLAYDQDKVAFDVLSQSATSEKASVSDLNSLEHNLNKLLSLLEDVSQYVDEVVAGKAAPNNAVGRALQQTLALLPTSEASFEHMFTNGVQDVLMVIYLANLTRSHLLLAERMRDQNAAAQQTQTV
eukprot:TRINITY_DN10406_c0_g1_i1.p1 TRINITY_DN10406_c0_g1~~TRINITY_DN10406_c0_g1_i1.p1  ORF type:complete len:295 (-),score=81.83 TRINITY_DN10406_c0_g1_i1:37-921(-)